MVTSVEQDKLDRELYESRAPRIRTIYKHVLNRCTSEKNKKYADYGGRGITISQEWYNPNYKSNRDEFRNFYNWSIMLGGYGPELWIDRINPNGNYEPDNCAWTTIQNQQNNKRNNKKIDFFGDELTIGQTAQALGIDYQLLYDYIYWHEDKFDGFFKYENTPYGLLPAVYAGRARNRGQVPICPIYYTDCHGYIINQADYVEPQPIPALWNMDKYGYVTTPML